MLINVSKSTKVKMAEPFIELKNSKRKKINHLISIDIGNQFEKNPHNPVTKPWFSFPIKYL